MYGPKGICDDIFLDLFNKPGIAKIKATKDEKNKIFSENISRFIK